MTETTVLTIDPHSGDNDDVPHIAFGLYVDKADREEVEYVLTVLANPSPDKPASNALLTGLAILALERQGYIGKAVAKMFPTGAPSEADAIAQINLLLEESAHVQH